MKINRLFSGALSLTLIILSSSCNDTGKYKITGEVPLLLTDNDIIYLTNLDNGTVLDSTFVLNGSFEFEGTIENSLLCALEAGALQSTFILEKGTITVDLSSPLGATGTKLNDQLNAFLSEITQLSQETEKRFGEISDNSLLSETEADLQLFTAQETFLLEIDKINTSYFLKNNNNALGLFVITVWLDFLTAERFTELYNSSGEYIQSNQGMKEILEAVQSASTNNQINSLE